MDFKQNTFFNHNISLSVGIVVGYVQKNVTVLESDGVALLTVAISMHSEAVPIEISFYLLVNTIDGSATATGLPQSQTLLCVPIHFCNAQQPTNGLALT